ncbi:MAG TPA: glycine--tRNA ligase subunit beta [Stellaceae bacterium]|nr:glycine--tRNA ligase subunit beta [Stellaceae bacterium]
MADYLLELLTEEIPARMQARASESLSRSFGEWLAVGRLEYTRIRSYVTPRRLVLVVEGLSEAQPDSVEERRGPRVGAPENAVQGFLKSAGLSSIDECVKRDTGKGVFYFALLNLAGRPTTEVLPEFVKSTVHGFDWPKSMRFPAAPYRWVRPINSVLSLFDGKVLPLDLGKIPVGHTTIGHRFLAPQRIPIKDFKDYKEKLDRAYVILDPEARRKKIAEALEKTARNVQLTLKHDPPLLDEVVGLVEHPIVLVGNIDPALMALPPEVLTASMRAHQKYFALVDGKGDLAPKFLVVSNMVARDGGKAIVAGNERVLRARLSDAQFFWDQDRKIKLEDWAQKLRERTFYVGLGDMRQKSARMSSLAIRLIPASGGGLTDDVKASRAALLAKADLSTGMVGEFPELQGVIGRYYALKDGEHHDVAHAIGEHYAPLGPNDICPSAPISVAVSLADKIDSLVGFFGIAEKPTGSKDPFALRRAALGVIRLIVENKLRIALKPVLTAAYDRYSGVVWTITSAERVAADLLAFFADRLKVHLREKGVRHDLITAVFTLGDEDDLVRLLARVAALGKFLKSDDGANLLVAYRRAANIVRIEEKKDGRSYDGPVRREALEMPEEGTLAERLEVATAKAKIALDKEAFDEAMTALAGLRAPVDEFFDRVTVNTDKPELRENRLRLLSEIRATLNRVADFSQIEG